jgi:AbrB family looped-hinge helix DNA binding protein
MAGAKKLMTVLSSKGQLVLPKSIREQRHWHAGTQLLVENTAEGVLLKAESIFPVTDPSHVFASLRHTGRPKTLHEMHAGIAREATRRHARNRY